MKHLEPTFKSMVTEVYGDDIAQEIKTVLKRSYYSGAIVMFQLFNKSLIDKDVQMLQDIERELKAFVLSLAKDSAKDS